jgi:hypothetical protein
MYASSELAMTCDMFVFGGGMLASLLPCNTEREREREREAQRQIRRERAHAHEGERLMVCTHCKHSARTATHENTQTQHWSTHKHISTRIQVSLSLC